jgi:hypothetical protein
MAILLKSLIAMDASLTASSAMLAQVVVRQPPPLNWRRAHVLRLRLPCALLLLLPSVPLATVPTSSSRSSLSSAPTLWCPSVPSVTLDLTLTLIAVQTAGTALPKQQASSASEAERLKFQKRTISTSSSLDLVPNSSLRAQPPSLATLTGTRCGIVSLIPYSVTK